MKLKLFINGDWIESESGEYEEVHSPVTGELLAEVPRGNREDVKKAIEAARNSRSEIADLSAFQRAELCHAIADELEENKQELARELSMEQGKVFRTEAVGDISNAIEMFRGAAEDIKRMETSVIPSNDPNKRIMTIRQPRGVYGVITPWNFPAQIPAEYLAAGLAGGNTIVWKPSSYTPIVAIRITECCDNAGLPKGVLNLVTGPGSTVGDEIAVNKDIDAVGLTGSSQVGHQVAQRAGAKPLLLELGGNGPTIVLEDADVVSAVKRCAFGCFRVAGQSCSAAERLLVHESIKDEFLEGMLEEVKRIKLGNPLDESTTMGPLNNEATASKVDEHLADARDKGAKIVSGGKRASGFPTKLYYEPTVIDEVKANMLLNVEETFGPVAPIISFADHEEAIELANNNELGLVSGIFTSDLRKAIYFGEKLETGNVNVNEVSSYWQIHSPFGGYSGKRSGIGRLGGKYTIMEMTQIKTIVLDIANVKIK